MAQTDGPSAQVAGGSRRTPRVAAAAADPPCVAAKPVTGGAPVRHQPVGARRRQQPLNRGLGPGQGARGGDARLSAMD